MAMVSYWLGDICGNRGNSMHSILVGRGMYTLGILLGMVAWDVVTLCHWNEARFRNRHIEVGYGKQRVAVA